MEYRWNRKFYDAQFKKYSIYVCSDITLMKSVLPVMNNYFSPLEIGAMGALLLIALVLLVVAYMYLPIEEHLNRKSGFIKVIVIIAVFSGVTSYGFKSGMLVDRSIISELHSVIMEHRIVSVLQP